jgi:hypothetical protein
LIGKTKVTYLIKKDARRESVTHKITGNRLIDVEALAAGSTLSYSSIISTRTEAALDDFVAYLQENAAINDFTTHLQNWKEGRGKELLDSDVKKTPLELHRCTRILVHCT